MSRFDFVFKHRPGAASTKPDLLSGCSDHDRGADDNDDFVLLKPEYFRIKSALVGHVLIHAEEKSILSSIRKSKSLDESVLKAVEELRSSTTKHLRSDDWKIEQDLILFRGKVYVPNDDNISSKSIMILPLQAILADGRRRKWREGTTGGRE